MSKIKEKFADLQSRKEKALISYIMAGFPNEKSTLSVVKGLVKGGVDIIELGFPFSDPLADGPVIQNASTISLEKGTKIDKFFALVKKIRRKSTRLNSSHTVISYAVFCLKKKKKNKQTQKKKQTKSSHPLCTLISL